MPYKKQVTTKNVPPVHWQAQSYRKLVLQAQMEPPHIGCYIPHETFSVSSRPQFRACEPDSFTEWLMERYTAFTAYRDKRRFFRVWHPHWPQTPVNVCVSER